MVGNHAFHRAGEVGVDDHGIGAMRPGTGADANRPATSEDDFFDWFVEEDFHAEPLRDASHRGSDGRAAADGMEHAVFVLKKAENAEQARAAEGRHAEVFRLETERQAHALVLEETLEVGVHRLMRAEHREHFQEAGVNQILPAEKGRLEARLHGGELAPVLVEEAAEAGRVSGGESGDLLLHLDDVWRAIELSTGTELNAILRVEPDHLDFVAQARARRSKDFLEHARVEEERRPEVEFVPVRLDARRAPADDGEALDDFNFHASRSQKYGGGESARAGAYDDGFFRHAK